MKLSELINGKIRVTEQHINIYNRQDFFMMKLECNNEKETLYMICPLCYKHLIIIDFYEDAIKDCRGNEINPNFLSICLECSGRLEFNPSPILLCKLERLI